MPLGKERFSWTGDIQPHEGNLIRGKALHPISTLHPEEWPGVRVYLEDELQKAAHTLIGAPLSLDHLRDIDGKVVGAQYEDGTIEYVAELNDQQVLDWIKDGTIKYCSVEYDWSSLDKVNGVAPKGIQFMGLALLKNFLPGDPQSSVEVWEALINRLKEAKQGLSEQNNLFVEALKNWLDSQEAEYPWDQCIADMKAQGHDDDSAASICAAIKRRTVSHALSKGLAKTIEEAVNLVIEKVSRDEVTGYLANAVFKQCNELREAAQQIVALEAFKAQATTLANEKAALEEKIQTLEAEKVEFVKRLGEAVIDPSCKPSVPEGYVSKEAVLSLLPARVPMYWGHGPIQLIRRMESLCEGKGKLQGPMPFVLSGFGSSSSSSKTKRR